MPFAVTHVITAIIVVGLYRDFFAKKKFATSFVVFAGLAGLLPDADLALGWILNGSSGGSIGVESIHRLFTHSLIWAILLAGLAIVMHFVLTKKLYKILNHKISKQSIILLLAILSAGWLIHIGLDCAFASSEELTLVPGTPLTCPSGISNLSLQSFDAILLLGWLFWEQHKHRIIDYV